MVRSYTLITIFLHFHVFGIDSRDVFHGLSKYSIVNPQVIHRWSKSINSPRHSKEYTFKKNNVTAVREEMVQMANLLDGYYKQLNIRVVLVGLEIFKDSNPFSVDGSAGNVLGNFVQWRKTFLIPKIRHDIGQLIVGQSEAYPGGVLGMAFEGTVCSASSSGGINVTALSGTASWSSSCWWFILWSFSFWCRSTF